MKKENAEQLKLGDLIEMSNMIGDIEIINECNETLIAISYVENNVCSLSKVLADDLLKRKVINFGSVDGRTMFKVEGMEDAE